MIELAGDPAGSAAGAGLMVTATTPPPTASATTPANARGGGSSRFRPLSIARGLMLAARVFRVSEFDPLRSRTYDDFLEKRVRQAEKSPGQPARGPALGRRGGGGVRATGQHRRCPPARA